MASHIVLVVDDEALVRMAIADILRDAQFDVIEAEDALSALDVLEKVPGVALLCTDVEMPGALDGLDLVLLVRRLHPQVRAIIVSGSAQTKAQAPDVPFLPKPFLPRDLVELAQIELGIRPGVVLEMAPG